jgi:hypothetical protein
MGAVTIRFAVLINIIDEIAANEVDEDEETGLPYSCPAEHHHSHHSVALG